MENDTCIDFRLTFWQRVRALLRLVLLLFPFYAVAFTGVYHAAKESRVNIGVVFLFASIIAVWFLQSVLNTWCFAESFVLSADSITYVSPAGRTLTRRWNDLVLSSYTLLMFNDGSMLPLCRLYPFYGDLLSEMRRSGGEAFTSVWRERFLPFRVRW